MIKIGNLKINGNLVLAPMAGFSDSPYRRIVKNFGAALVYTELVSAEGIIRKNIKTTQLMRFTDEERPLGIQIFGSKPDLMTEASKIAEELSPDYIDINAGCPARRVLHGGSGAGLLSNPELLGKIAYNIVKSVNIPVSVKIRIGIDADNKNYPEILNILQDSGISFISVHGRTKAQGFGGEADWDAIKHIKEISKVPVIGNGDIMSHVEALRRIESSGCDAVMIGRGAIGNPWIFSGLVPEYGDIIMQMLLHLDLMTEFYGESGIILFRKHIVKYIRGMKDSARLRAKLVIAKNKEEIIAHLENYVKRDFQ